MADMLTKNPGLKETSSLQLLIPTNPDSLAFLGQYKVLGV
jgi:hypothetical protein